LTLTWGGADPLLDDFQKMSGSDDQLDITGIMGDPVEGTPPGPITS
jgi:hypothetical protein